MTQVAVGKTERIRLLNDKFRSTLLGGHVVMTHGVSELPPEVKTKVKSLVRMFNDFTRDNDPYGEHDFGMFKVADNSFYWKIDYYDQDCKYGSDDPSDPGQTTRVLTIMLAAEY